MAPLIEGLVGGLREAEIDGPGEELLGAIDLAGREKFLGPDQTQQLTLLGADQVLSAVAAGQGQIGGPAVAALGDIGQKRRVFVVRVGADQHQAAQNVELL